jgi:hypothetical protein
MDFGKEEEERGHSRWLCYLCMDEREEDKPKENGGEKKFPILF